MHGWVDGCLVSNGFEVIVGGGDNIRYQQTTWGQRV